jgi:hypothetical protein
MQGDSLEQFTQCHVLVLGQSLEDLDKPFLEANAGLHPLDGDGIRYRVSHGRIGIYAAAQ